MSEVNNAQTVVDEVDPLAKPSGETAPNARKDDDLDTLLNDPVFNATKSDPNPKPATKAEGTDDSKAVLEQMRGLLTEQQRVRFQQDMQTTVKKVRGDLPEELFDDALVEAWLDKRARDNPALSQAWTQRHENPRQFQKIVDALGRDFHKKYGNLPDKKATEDREVVTAAVRGASTKAPEGKAPDFSGLSNAEYREAVKKEYGFDPNVG